MCTGFGPVNFARQMSSMNGIIHAKELYRTDPNVRRKTCFDTESDLLIQHSHIAWNIKWEMIVTENILKN